MKSKFKSNPFLRHSLVTAAAILAMGSAHAATYNWQGDTDANFTEATNWVEGAWTQWDDYRFGSATTSGAVTINSYFGIGSLTLESGLPQDIVITSTNAQPVIMNTAFSNGGVALISINAASKNLTINGEYIANNTVTWDVGAGRTLTMNGPLNQWFEAASLVKNGAGTAVLSGAFGFSGGAAINGGTLELNVASGSRDLGNMTFSGAGTLRKTGAGSVGWGAGSATFALGAGSLIDVQEGSFGCGFANENWTGNLSGLNVASGASFTGVEANVRVDALTGAGTISSGYPGAGYQNFTFGVNGGGGTFSGILADSDTAPANFVKAGSGTQALTGSNTYTGTTTVNGGTLSLGNGTANTNLADGATVSIAFGTTVNLNFTGTDTVGKLIIDGQTLSGGTYSSSTPVYGSYFTGSGSLTVLNQSGTWTSTASGNWSDSSKWLTNVVATGTDKTATFSAGTGSEAITVTLDSSRDIANLAFSNANYTITGNTLTLDSTTTLSSISVASGNTATISSPLAGTADVEKSGVGTLTLSGGLSYSGTTTVVGGTLALQGGGGGGSTYNGGSLSINGASTLRVNGQRYNFNGKTFTFDSVGGGTLDAIASGAGGLVFEGSNTFATSGGAQNIISGTKSGGGNEGFNLNGGNTAIFDVATGSDATSDLKVTGTIWNTGNVTKNGAGRLEISAPQQYAGTTTVNEGTLILGDGTNNIGLSDSNDVTVETGATLRLNYSVGNTDSIDELWLGGVQQSPGVYGAGTYSGVTITGTGTLTVQNGPITDPFANWMATNYPGIVSPNNQPGADPDNDGIANLVEYVLQGGNPSVSTTGILPTVNASGANFVFTYFRRAAATGTIQTFESSTTLGAGSWTPVAIPGGSGVVVTPDTPSAGIDKVEITVAKGANTKLFGRLQVVK